MDVVLVQVVVDVGRLDAVELVQLDVREFTRHAELADLLLRDSELVGALCEGEGRHHGKVLLQPLRELLRDERGEFDGFVFHAPVP